MGGWVPRLTPDLIKAIVCPGCGVVRSCCYPELIREILCKTWSSSRWRVLAGPFHFFGR